VVHLGLPEAGSGPVRLPAPDPAAAPVRHHGPAFPARGRRERPAPSLVLAVIHRERASSPCLLPSLLQGRRGRINEVLTPRAETASNPGRDAPAVVKQERRVQFRPLLTPSLYKG
jgi:hypothetical protein